MNIDRKSPTRTQQTGAALAVSLILLLIMTVVGVAAMNGARLEVSVAGLRQDEEVALRRVERLVALFEAYLDENTVKVFDTDVEGFYLPEVTRMDGAVTDWTGIENSNESTNAGLTVHERLMVEYLGLLTLHGDSENVGGDQPISGSKVRGYRITGRSDTDGKAVRIVETLYLKPHNVLDPGV